jgi:hypothetical protein
MDIKSLEAVVREIMKSMESQKIDSNEQVEKWAKNRAELKKKRPLIEESVAGWRVIKEEAGFRLTPAIANYLQQINIFEPQRNWTDRRVDEIAEAVLRRSFHGNSLKIAICGETYLNPLTEKSSNILLVNGGNSTMAALKYGITIPHNTLKYCYCPTITDVKDLYISIDKNHSNRTPQENNRAYIVGSNHDGDWRDDQNKLSSAIFSDCVTAVCAAIYGPGYRSKLKNHEQKVVEASKYHDSMLWLKDFMFDEKNKAPKEMKRAVGVMGIMAKTYIFWGEEVCASFWQDVKMGFRSTPNDRMSGKSKTPQNSLWTYLTGACKEDNESNRYYKVQYAVNAWAKRKEGAKLSGKEAELVSLCEVRPHPNHLPTQEEIESGDF